MGSNHSSGTKQVSSSASIVKNNEDPSLIHIEKLAIGKDLGQGSFGIVRHARWTRPNGQVIEVAVKSLHLLSGTNDTMQSETLKEIKNMQQLDHPHIVKLHGITIDPIQVVVELCKEGALVKRLQDKTNVLLVTQLLNYAKQLCSGMAYLEKQKCIHRDLATRNILLTDNEKVIKIADFGMTKFLEGAQFYYIMKSVHGIPYPWCPPEVVEDKKFSHKSDVWSYGVTLWEMFTYGEMPWKECHTSDGFNEILMLSKILYEKKKLDKPDRASPEIYEIMCSCWEIDKHLRPSFESLKTILSNKKFKYGESHVAQKNSCNNGLELVKNEKLIIINKEASNRWFGQNIRTLEFGYFNPKNILQLSNPPKDLENGFPKTINRAKNNTNAENLSPETNANATQDLSTKNNSKSIVEAWVIGQSDVKFQMEGCQIVMYPQEDSLKDLLEEKELHCCIGCPTEKVIEALNIKFSSLKWIVWRDDTVVALHKYNVSSKRIFLLKKKPNDVKESFDFVESQKIILTYGLERSADSKKKFYDALISLGIKKEDFVILSEKQGLEHHVVINKANNVSFQRGLFQYISKRWRRNTIDADQKAIINNATKSAS